MAFIFSMNINESFIIDFLRYKAGRPLKPRELAKEIGVTEKEYVAFRRLIKELIDSGRLVDLRGGKIGVPSDMNLVVGTIAITRGGKGTIFTEAGEPVVIDSPNLLTALDGDKVMVRVGSRPEQELQGTVIKVIERAEKDIVGIFQRGKHFSTVIPDDKKVRRNIYVPNTLSKEAGDGERVVAKISAWDDPYRNPEGEVLDVLGKPGDQGVDIKTVIRSFNLPRDFPPAVIEEAGKVGAYLSSGEIKRRRDFTREVVYTIDPIDAKDFDDAITVSKTPNGYRLGVFIADVSFYVRDNTQLDREAFNRGNSVYLPGMVIPMLPEELSNDLCSLKPNKKRLVYAIIINFDRKGKALDWEITDGVINSRARLNYEEVQAFFDSGTVTDRIERIADNLTVARELAQILHSLRMANGSLDFDLPKPMIIINKKGEIAEIRHSVRLESHRLVEEFMLAANQAVAANVSRLGQKFLYRVHDRPDLEKLEAFSYLMTTLGYNFPVSETVQPMQFSKFLLKVKGKPEEELINELMLRSMKKAVYQPGNVGHFGLAFKHYTHFTSPIRRYPDLIVHRLLRKLADGHYPVKLAQRLDNILSNIGRHCSDTERNAEAAEREAVKYKQVAYMSKHVGEQFKGVISGVLNFGFFVRLIDLGVEGMVRVSTLGDDYYLFEERRYRLVGRRTGRIFRMGDPVEVGVLSVDLLKNDINFYLVELPPPVQKDRPKKGGRRVTPGKGRRRRK
ncbi:MAG: ribonuclease R [candidate division Zixibacteria bacterium HGW-Zixibacteria-1]|nr:MAG: ribonuclease R [candidate division Zixibacteria bacterium HGW-Zixibacteria-1]